MVDMLNQNVNSNSTCVETNLNFSKFKNIDWSMFKKEADLGEGAFGKVYKVKCIS